MKIRELLVIGYLIAALLLFVLVAMIAGALAKIVLAVLIVVAVVQAFRLLTRR